MSESESAHLPNHAADTFQRKIIVIITGKARAKGGGRTWKVGGVNVMKDKEVTTEEIEASLKLCGAGAGFVS